MDELNYSIYAEKGAQALAHVLPNLLDEARATSKRRPLSFVSVVCIDLRKYQDAIDLITREINLFDSNDTMWNNLGYCCECLERNGLAYEAYMKSLGLNPLNISSLKAATYLAIELGLKDDALRLSNELLEKAPDFEQGPLWRVIALNENEGKDAVTTFVSSWSAKHAFSEELHDLLAVRG
jgi:tetratricopeptide (TPR) repeat protein